MASRSAQAVAALTVSLLVALLSAQGATARPKNVWIALSGSPLSRVEAEANRAVACLRSHGIRDLRRPTVEDGEVFLLLPRGYRRGSPRLMRAHRACREFLPPLPKSGAQDDDSPSTSCSPGPCPSGRRG